ncbi:MAG: hypothetical protein FIA99_19890 [Ruminiclostridium sp.]|nr:hypothetical protein [Ruminiclostridium sp.]
MTSKERTSAAFSGKNGDRLPMWYGGAPETTHNIMNFLGADTEDEAMEIAGIDFRTLRPKYVGPELKTYDDGSYDTIWGIKRGGYHYGQPLNHPLANAECVGDVDKYMWPEIDWWDVKLTKQEIKLAEDYFIIGGMWAPFFHDVTEFLGMEKCFIDMYLNPGLVEAVTEKIFNYYYGLSEKAFEENKGLIDMFFFGNDFGSQRGLLCSPEMWRNFFKPGIEKLVTLGHKYNIKTALHSCGDIHEIIPDLIDIGLDAVNPIQVNAENMDPAVLKRKFGKDIVFFGGIDENVILATGTEEEVRKETRRIIDILGADGKYIVAASHDYLLPEIPAANICAMFDEAKKYSASRG